MPTREECVCCRQVDEFLHKTDGDGGPAVPAEGASACITDHEGFSPVCLNIHVLETAWLQYKQQYGRQAYDGPVHKRLRHVAYRQIVRWIYGYLGKDIRVVIPSCAICKIRAFFPPPELEDNAVFVGFLFKD